MLSELEFSVMKKLIAISSLSTKQQIHVLGELRKITKTKEKVSLI